MGWDHHNLNKLPALYTIVGCAWPLDENPEVAGPRVRPCLVVRRSTLRDENGVLYGTLHMSYGSKEWTPEQARRDCIIDQSEYRALGLSFPTRFSVDRIEEFVWGPKWFPPHPYIANRGVRIGGPLKQPQIDRWLECLNRYKATKSR